MNPKPGAEGRELGMFYRLVRGLVRGALRSFYRKIEITGLEHLDPSVPTILACNHQNSIIDPLLVALFEERAISFCARDGLFKIPGFGSLLRAFGAIPLQRRSDRRGGAVDNATAFSACRDVLIGGGVIAIFPEGKTHERMRIEPLKTGTARIALDAEAARPGLGVRIVPVGITYLVRHAFLSDVHVALGEPLHVDAIAKELDGLDERERVRELTAKVETALRSLAVHVEEAEDERFIAQVTSIIAAIRADDGLDEGGQSPAERIALARRVVDAYRWQLDVDPLRTAELRARLEAYMDERLRLGLGGERPTLQHRGERRKPRGIGFLVAGAPLAAYGLAVSLAPYLLLRVALRIARPSHDRIALFKLLGGTASFSACWAAEIAGVATAFGALPAAVFGASLLPAAVFAQRYATETRLHRIQLRSLNAVLGREGVEALRNERRAIADELAEIRRRYLAEAVPG
jgi:1-acyl-sn-glycerol-3-phosphate acyltransferase